MSHVYVAVNGQLLVGQKLSFSMNALRLLVAAYGRLPTTLMTTGWTTTTSCALASWRHTAASCRAWAQVGLVTGTGGVQSCGDVPEACGGQHAAETLCCQALCLTALQAHTVPDLAVMVVWADCHLLGMTAADGCLGCAEASFDPLHCLFSTIVAARRQGGAVLEGRGATHHRVCQQHST